MEATEIIPVRSSTLLLLVVRMIHLLVAIHLLYLSHPSRPSDILGGSDSVMIPLGQVLGVVAGGSEDDPEGLCRLKVLTNVS